MLLGIACITVYLVTAPAHLMGYQGETAAVSEGLVRTGIPQVLRNSPMRANGHVGRGGRLYGRSTLVEPVAQAPLMAVGVLLDQLSTHGRSPTFRMAAAKTYLALVSALGVLAVFGIVFLRLRRPAWACLIGALYAFASLAWPYSQIGMETTFATLLLLAVLATLWAREQPTGRRQLLAGIALGLAATATPYGILPALPLIGLLLWRARSLPPLQLARAGAAVLGPVLVCLVVMLLYNQFRQGSLTDFGDAERLTPTIAAPLNWMGLMISPGKGLLLYSPLVLLGLLGLKPLWQRDRELLWCVVAPTIVLFCFIGISRHWSDETWGPRYIVPVAGLLLVPIPWWVHGRRRRRLLGGVAAVAVVIQLLAVLVSYAIYFDTAASLTGVPLFQQRTSGLNGTDVPDSVAAVPYGRDGMRWVPGVSPLLLQGEVVVSSVAQALTGRGLTVTYDPFEGRTTHVDLTGIAAREHLTIPDFWWWGSARNAIIALVVLLTGALLAHSALRQAGWRGRSAARAVIDPPVTG